VLSYHRTFGVRTVSLPCNERSSWNSSSRSLSNTPVSGGGSARSTKLSSDPSAHRTVARALSRLYPPLIGRKDVTAGPRSGSA